MVTLSKSDLAAAAGGAIAGYQIAGPIGGAIGAVIGSIARRVLGSLTHTHTPARPATFLEWIHGARLTRDQVTIVKSAYTTSGNNDHQFIEIVDSHTYPKGNSLWGVDKATFIINKYYEFKNLEEKKSIAGAASYRKGPTAPSFAPTCGPAALSFAPARRAVPSPSPGLQGAINSARQSKTPLRFYNSTRYANTEFLGNFHICQNPLMINGCAFRNSEALFQAGKFYKLSLKQQFPGILNTFSKLTPDLSIAKARKFSGSYGIRNDWISRKANQSLMEAVLRLKYESNPQLRTNLLATQRLPLIESPPGNRDIFWGVNETTGIGQNMLGKLHMKLRAEMSSNNGNLRWSPRSNKQLFDSTQFDPNCGNPSIRTTI